MAVIDSEPESTVDMKERKTTSTLKRILVNCGAQAKEYGSCVAAKVPDVEKDMCLKEFLALKSCMQNVSECRKFHIKYLETAVGSAQEKGLSIKSKDVVL
ncbi:hypothetical protein PanWU01x14_317320 [Parasponia andersonii]|uniref:Uncharacterized protein n=1 Tax=Parasponia andersonii TaxID=3476 RepID=A0A2P5AMM6_PARAD|nr:hypothetical protein PanWU01x14_317320 [Parasponia andersonii]